MIILADMPVTAIGKIFKPTLRQLATDRVYAAELAALESLTATVATGPDDRLGTCAVVTLTRGDGTPVPDGDRAALVDRVEQILGRFPVPHRVVFG